MLVFVDGTRIIRSRSHRAQGRSRGTGRSNGRLLPPGTYTLTVGARRPRRQPTPLDRRSACAVELRYISAREPTDRGRAPRAVSSTSASRPTRGATAGRSARARAWRAGPMLTLRAPARPGHVPADRDRARPLRPRRGGRPVIGLARARRARRVPRAGAAARRRVAARPRSPGSASPALGACLLAAALAPAKPAEVVGGVAGGARARGRAGGRVPARVRGCCPSLALACVPDPRRRARAPAPRPALRRRRRRRRAARLGARRTATAAARAAAASRGRSPRTSPGSGSRSPGARTSHEGAIEVLAFYVPFTRARARASRACRGAGSARAPSTPS